MSDQTHRYEKDFGPDDAVRERTGIYAFGFSLASLAGFLVPGAIAFASIILAYLIYKYL